jgi:hypothetical protein
MGVNKSQQLSPPDDLSPPGETATKGASQDQITLLKQSGAIRFI